MFEKLFLSEKIDESKKIQVDINADIDNIQDLINNFRENGLDFDLFKKEVETQFKWQELIYNIYTISLVVHYLLPILVEMFFDK